MTAAEDVIVQIRDQKGDWTDYARTTRAAALAAVAAVAAVAAGILLGHTAPEPIRAVDWITHEEVAVSTKSEDTAPATITAPEAAKKLGTEPKLFRRFLRSDASPIAPVGQGARYALDPKVLPKLKKGSRRGRLLTTPSAERKAAKDSEAKAETTNEKPEPKAKSLKSEAKVTKTDETIAAAKPDSPKPTRRAVTPRVRFRAAPPARRTRPRLPPPNPHRPAGTPPGALVLCGVTLTRMTPDAITRSRTETSVGTRLRREVRRSGSAMSKRGADR